LGKATGSIEIEASPEKVFDFVFSEKMNDLTKEFYEGKWTSDGPVGVGSIVHYVGTHKHNKGEEWNAKVTEFVKNKNLTMHLTGANKRSHDETHFYSFEPTVKGTKMTFTMDYEMPYSVLGKLIDGLVVKNWVEKENNKVMENLKKALEA
jgi:ligand-binding SRPBCC domain-containing protein